MNLELRDQLAEWLLAALAQPEAGARVRALATFAEQADASGLATGLSAADAQVLSASDLFERSAPGLRLRPDLLSDLEALRRRAGAFAQAIEASNQRCGHAPTPPAAYARRFSGSPPSDRELAWALCAGAALFNAELFFEVHEVLEPLWCRAEGALKLLLQGLIQVAVGLHHRSNGNLRGAAALLAEGNAKLRIHRPEAWGIELAAFCSEVERIERSLQEEIAGRSPGGSSAPLLDVRIPAAPGGSR